MKVRIYPKTEAVRSILTDRIGEHERVISENNTELAKLNATGMYAPSTELSLRNSSVLCERSIVDLKRQVTLLDSHGQPESLVEIEL